MPSRTLAVDVRFRARPGAQEIDTQAISQVTNGPGVRRDLRRRAENVRDYQVRNVGVKSGRLRATVRILDRGTRNGSINIVVVMGRKSLTPYLSHHIYGTASHEIRPKGPGYPLRFYWPKVGAFVAFMKVQHPGTKANTVLTDSTRFWRP